MKKSTLLNLALMAASLVIAFLFAELGLRVIQKVRNGTPITAMIPEGGRQVFPRSPFLVFGPRVNVHFARAGRPEWGSFNDMGIRLPFPTPDREPREVRILALGGSTTEGLAADLGKRDVGLHWPLGLECLLRARGRDDVRVLNGAMSAYTTAHSLVRFALDLVETRPDVVLIKHNINDLMVTYRAASLGTTVDPNYLVRYGRKRWTGYIDESDVVTSRVLHSARVRLLGDREAAALVPHEQWQYDLQRSEHYFRRNLIELIRSVRHSGATPVLLTESRSSDASHVAQARALHGVDVALTLYPVLDQFYRDFDRFNEVIREIAAAERIPLVDVARALPEDNGLFLDVVHHSEEGVRRIAHIVDSLTPTFLPPPTGASLDTRQRVSCDGAF